MAEDRPKPMILAVDDTPENLDVVKGILAEDYVVKAAVNGKLASADVYPSGRLFKRLWPKALNACAVEAASSGSDDTPAPDLDAVRQLLESPARGAGSRVQTTPVLEERSLQYGDGQKVFETRDTESGSWIRLNYLAAE